MTSLILASKSKARQGMLRKAGIEFQAIPAEINEDEIQASGMSADDISMALAREKALTVSKKNKEKYIIGSDQVLSMNDIVYSKASNTDEARDRLKEFSGKTHILYSSVAVAKNSEIIFECTDHVSLKMKILSNEKIEEYINEAGDALTQCVGCYAIEGRGITLFEKISGDYFTILGMPLLPLLNFLEGEGAL